MIGIFEHQYLSYKKNHLRNLLALARADGHLDPKEEMLLFRIGQRYGLKDRQIRAILEQDEPLTLHIPDDHTDKMNLIYDLLLMIHADDKVVAHEVDFFRTAVTRFGMREEMVPWLLEAFTRKGTPPPAEDWEAIKFEAKQRFLIE